MNDTSGTRMPRKLEPGDSQWNDGYRTGYRDGQGAAPVAGEGLDECEEHERTVDQLQDRLAELEGAYNEAMTKLAANQPVAEERT